MLFGGAGETPIGCELRSQVSFEKTFVSLPEIFTAGVLMSEIISSTNKLHFVPRLDESHYGTLLPMLVKILKLCGMGWDK